MPTETTSTLVPREEVLTLLRVATPLIIMFLGISSMQFVDAYVVSMLGVEELAAILPAERVWFVILSFSWGFFAVVTVSVAQLIGSDSDSQVGTYGWAAVWLAILYGVLITCIGWPLARPLFTWLGAEPDIVDREVDFFQILLLATLPHVTQVALSNFFNGIQQTKILLYTSLLGSLTNAVLTYPLVFGVWFFPELGLKGAGWSTVIANIVQFVALFLAFRSRLVPERFATSKPTWRIRPILVLLRLGLPSGASGVIATFMDNIVFVAMITSFGQATMASYVIADSFSYFVHMPVTAVSIIMASTMGKSIGEGAPEDAAFYSRICRRLFLGYTVLCGLVLILFSDPLARLFSSEPDVVSTSFVMFVCAAVYYCFDSLRLVFMDGLRAAGDVTVPAVAHFVFGVGILGGLGWIFLREYSELGVLGPWAARILFIAAFGGFLGLRWFRGAWKSIDMFGDKESREPRKEEVL